jgi:hypothetical protein
MITDEIEHIGRGTSFYDFKSSEIPYGLKEKIIII